MPLLSEIVAFLFENLPWIISQEQENSSLLVGGRLKFSRYLLHSRASDVHYRQSGHKGSYNSGQIGAQTPTSIPAEIEPSDTSQRYRSIVVESTMWIIDLCQNC